MNIEIVKENQKLFEAIFQKYIHRDGAENLLNYLRQSDFFTAPASRSNHLGEEGGLCLHSLHVYNRLCEIAPMMVQKNLDGSNGAPICVVPNEESIAIVALLHDLCKVNFYTVEMKNKKVYSDHGTKHDSAGWYDWDSVPSYTIKDNLPLGHGEKSAMIVLRYMDLTDEELLAIRWHMGFSDTAFKAGDRTISLALDMCPLAIALHMADMSATFFDEKGAEANG